MSRPKRAGTWNPCALHGILALGVLLAFAGCRTTSNTDPARQFPDDFMLAVTVLAPESSDVPDVAPAFRPSRYVIEADSVLRVSLGAGSRPNTLPPPLRTLSRDQVAGLWDEVQTSGILQRTTGRRLAREFNIPPTNTTTRYLIWVMADGKATTVILDGAEMEVAQPLMSELTRLSWQR